MSAPASPPASPPPELVHGTPPRPPPIMRRPAGVRIAYPIGERPGRPLPNINLERLYIDDGRRQRPQ